MNRRITAFLLDNGVIVFFVAMLLLFSLMVPSFFTLTNTFNVLRQVTIFGTMALGVTYVVLCGKLDLSVGSMLSFCTVLVLDLHNKMGPGPAIVITLLVALACGAINGFLVGYLQLNYFIATLAMLSILQGVTLIYSGGKNIDVVNQEGTWFAFFGRGYLGPVPMPVLIFAALAVLLQVLLKCTLLGRKVMAVGGNPVAAHYSGINERKIILQSYLISATTTAIAAMILGSRVMGTQNNVGENYELIVLSAIILGGTSLLGGSGSVVKTVFGVLILGFIENGLLLQGFEYYVQWIVTWFLLIGVASVDLKIRSGSFRLLKA